MIPVWQYYRPTSESIPIIAGSSHPRAVFSRAEYERPDILQRIYREIAPHDPKGILQDEWLNSRGAIARFERNAIEIRLLDIQECPAADLAIAAAIIAVLKKLVREEWSDFTRQKESDEERLLPLLLQCIEAGEKTVISDPDYLALFSFPGRAPRPGSCGRT